MVDDNFIDIPADINKIDGIDLSIFKYHVEQTLLNILDSVLIFIISSYSYQKKTKLSY